MGPSGGLNRFGWVFQVLCWYAEPFHRPPSVQRAAVNEEPER